MNNYVKDTKFAASSLLNLINDEENRIHHLNHLLTENEKRHKLLYDDFTWKDFDPDSHFNEYQLMHTYAKQYSYYMVRVEPINREINALKKSVLTKHESIKSLSAALLQIAKQGISSVHGGLDHCPNGRLIKNEPIKNIIWQARNQSMHYEEGDYRRAVRKCFEKIDIALINDNLAKVVIDFLDWKSYESYEKDIVSLLK